MANTITLRVSYEQMQLLESGAKELNLTLTDYILHKSMADNLDSKLTINKIVERVKPVDEGQVFTIKSLYSKDEWDAFTAGSKIAACRLFLKYHRAGKSPVAGLARFEGKTGGNLVKYVKL